MKVGDGRCESQSELSPTQTESGIQKKKSIILSETKNYLVLKFQTKATCDPTIATSREISESESERNTDTH